MQYRIYVAWIDQKSFIGREHCLVFFRRLSLLQQKLKLYYNFRHEMTRNRSYVNAKLTGCSVQQIDLSAFQLVEVRLAFVFVGYSLSK